MLDFKQVSEKIEQYRTENHIAGMSVAVTDMNGTIYKKGFGYENALRPQIPTYPDAMYKIASMTKTITTVVILRLCQEGHLDLNTPIKKYLPWLTLSRPEAEETMTLRHLLTHTSGLPKDGYLPEGVRDESGIDDAIKETVPKLPMVSLPGDGVHCYSNWGFNLAACVATTVTGKALKYLYNEYVFAPVGMNRTTFDFYEAATYPLSLPHKRDAEGQLSVIHHQRINMAYSGGGGLYSCADDMCEFARFLLRGGVTKTGEHLLSEESLADMCSKHILRDNETGTFYGLGMFVRPFADRYIYGHTGNYDPYNSSAFLDYKTGLGVVTLYNTNNSELRFKIPEMIFGMME